MNTHTVPAASNADPFVIAMLPAFMSLQEKLHTFRTKDLSELNEHQIMTVLAKVEEAEHEVMLTWAESIRDINPTMYKDVVEGRLKFTPKTEEYLNRVIGAAIDGGAK
tara:strand:+ start:242 stop:565 length:324 start_codon:yes stop_codon:yes gene_type:complete